MNWHNLPLQPTRRVLAQFAGAWLLFFLTAAAYQALYRHHQTAGYVLGSLALVGLAGLLKPGSVRWLFIGVTVITFPIGWVVTQVSLAVMFYLVLTPLAVLFRRRRRDELQLRRQSERASFWHTRSADPDPERYLKPF
jgi:hypothetical protein